MYVNFEAMHVSCSCASSNVSRGTPPKTAQIQRVVFPTKIAFLGSIFKKFFLPKKDILPGISYPCQS